MKQNIKIAKELVKIAEDLFNLESSQETEHDKIKKIMEQCVIYNNDTVQVYLSLSDDLITKLNESDLSKDNIDGIIIKLILCKDGEYEADSLIKSLNKINKHAKYIQNKIKSQFNKNVEIKLNYN